MIRTSTAICAGCLILEGRGNDEEKIAQNLPPIISSKTTNTWYSRYSTLLDNISEDLLEPNCMDMHI